jgi:hypothetical protein
MSQDAIILEQPRVHLVHMMVFTLVVVVLAAVLFPKILPAFYANPGLNALIIVTLILGMMYSYRMVARLFPEVNWVNNFRMGETSDLPPPTLLGPMATLLQDARDLVRYLVGLLIFLGLLGTFWGLLETVSSVGDAIRNLDVSSAASASVFEELKTGLQRPLAGMGLSFSSSLFGLSGSLILGFMDLKAAQAQNRFYHNFEDWLSTITDVQAGDGSGSVPAYMRADMSNIQRTVDKWDSRLNRTRRLASPLLLAVRRLSNWLTR